LIYFIFKKITDGVKLFFVYVTSLYWSRQC